MKVTKKGVSTGCALKTYALVPFLFAFLAFPLCVNATTIDFYTDGTIQSGDNYDQVNIWNTARLNMTGGSAYIVEAHNISTFQFQAGNVTGWISVFDTSTLTLSGGSVDDLQLFGSGIANISGGTITGWLGMFSSTAMVGIYGKNLNSIPHSGGGWLITGNWDDAYNSPFSIWYRAGYSSPKPNSSNSQIVFHEIPEPCMFGLFGFGLFLVRRNLKIIRK